MKCNHLFLVFFSIFFYSSLSFAAMSTSGGAGGTLLCTTGYTTLTSNLLMIEGANGDIGAQAGVTIILTIPAGFEFNPGVGTVNASSGDLNTMSIVVAATKITITLTATAPINTKDSIIISGIQVKATATVPTIFNIRRLDADDGTAAAITGITNTTDLFTAFSQGTTLAYTSCTTTQTNTSNIVIPSTSKQIIGVQIVASGDCGTLDATSFTFNTTNCDNPATNVTNAKLWYTSTSSTFATTTQVGPTFVGPSGSFDIVGTQALVTGTNYFWLTYDIPGGANSGDSVDAECTALTVGIARVPTVTAPDGARPLGITTVNSLQDGAWNVAATWDCACTPTSGNNVIINTTHDITDAGADMSVNNLTISGTGTFTVGAFTLSIYGTGPALGSSLITSCATSLAIEDNGGAVQFVFPTVTSIIKKLTMNRATGATSDHDIDLDNCVPADSIVLVLTNGILEFTGTGMLYMASAAIQRMIACSDASHVDGKVQRVTTANDDEFYVFPVGDGGVSRKFAIASPGSAQDVQFFYTLPVNYDCLAAGLPGGVIPDYYWIHDRIGAGNPQRRLYYEYTDFGLTAAERADGTLSFSDGEHDVIPNGPACADASSKWGSSTGGVTVNDAGKYIQHTVANASNNKYWTWGSTGTAINLPIKLLSFNARPEKNKIKLSWSTASEINNDFFTIERSADNENFEEIIKEKGAGNSNQVINYKALDEYPLPGIAYYRLKQTDFDGKFVYSDLLAVDSKLKGTLKVYPNPSNGNNTYVSFTGRRNEEILVVVYDIMGRTNFSKVLIVEDGKGLVAIDPSQKLTPGVYLVVASSETSIFNQKLTVK